MVLEKQGIANKPIFLLFIQTTFFLSSSLEINIYIYVYIFCLVSETKTICLWADFWEGVKKKRAGEKKPQRRSRANQNKGGKDGRRLTEEVVAIDTWHDAKQRQSPLHLFR